MHVANKHLQCIEPHMKLFILLGSTNSDEAPNAIEHAPTTQDLQRNGQVAITISQRFDCCKGSNVSLTTRNSDFVKAIQDGLLDQVKQLLDIDGIDVNLTEADNITYLHTAVFNNQVEIAKYLLSKGAEVGAGGGEVKSTPLHVAAEKGYFEVYDKD